MVIVLIVLSAVFILALGMHMYKRLKQRRLERMRENEYNAAVTLWNFARDLKLQIDDALRQGSGVLDFKKITIPHSQGYRLSLELSGYSFRLLGLPDRYARTSRLSFHIDNTLKLRAGDHNGKPASESDAEYEGDAGS